MRVLRVIAITMALIATPLLATAQCVPVAGNWPVLYGQVGYYTDGNPTIAGLAGNAASQWTSAIQANSSADNNYAYANMGIYANSGNQVSVSLVPPIPGAWALTTYHPGQTPAYVVQVGEDTFAQSAGFAQAVLNQEFGHVVGFDDVTTSGCETSTVMGPLTPSSFTTFGPADRNGVNNNYPPPAPWNCNPTDCSPIILDLGRHGFELTGPEVSFDLTGAGHPQLLGWTASGAEDGFLVLDRNGNGTIDNGTELFGDFTPIGWGPMGRRANNGFEALAWFDNVANGGNGDGAITAVDAVFDRLRVWVDRNHNGISEPDELKSLAECGVISISLTVHESRRTDEFGNIYRFISEMSIVRGDHVRRSRAVDVFLATGK